MKYLLFFCLIIPIACVNDDPRECRLLGTIDVVSSDTLFVTDFVHTQKHMDTIIVTNGKFEYTLTTPVQDVRRVFSKSRRFVFDFITEPGEYAIDFTQSEHTISGKFNKELKAGKAITTKLMNKKYSLERSRISSSTLKSIKEVEQELKELNMEIKSTLLSISSKNKQNAISAVAVWASLFLLPEDTQLFDRLYENVDTRYLENTTLGALLTKHRNQRTLPANIPTAILLDETFYEIELADILGKYTFVDFWASWCAPCRKEIPKLKQIYAEYESNENLRIVSVSTDSDYENWTRARIEEKMMWDQYVVKDNVNDEILSQHWGKVSIPFGILIGPDRKTIANGIRSVYELDSILSTLELQ